MHELKTWLHGHSSRISYDLFILFTLPSAAVQEKNLFY